MLCTHRALEIEQNNYYPCISLLSLSFTIFCPREASIRGKIRGKKLADVFFSPQNCRVVLKILSISYLSFSHSLLLFLSKIGTNTWDEVVGKSDGKRTNVWSPDRLIPFPIFFIRALCFFLRPYLYHLYLALFLFPFLLIEFSVSYFIIIACCTQIETWRYCIRIIFIVHLSLYLRTLQTRYIGIKTRDLFNSLFSFYIFTDFIV